MHGQVWNVICDVVGHGHYDHKVVPEIGERTIGQVARDAGGAYVWCGLSETASEPRLRKWRGPVDGLDDAIAALHAWIGLDTAVSRYRIRLTA